MESESLNEPLLSTADPNGAESEDQEDATAAETETNGDDPPPPSLLHRIIQPIVKVFHLPIIPETEGDLKVQIRFLKFLAITFLGIVITRSIIFSLVRRFAT